MKNILWQTRSAIVADSIRSGILSPDANGGNAYDVHAAGIIKTNYKLDVSEAAIFKNESLIKYWHRMRVDNPKTDVIIREPYPIVFGSRPRNIPCIGMIHHIDDALGKSSLSIFGISID